MRGQACVCLQLHGSPGLAWSGAHPEGPPCVRGLMTSRWSQCRALLPTPPSPWSRQREPPKLWLGEMWRLFPNG